MTPEAFTYWLQGFVEIQDSDTISEKQWMIIKDHLKLVFDKKTPQRSNEDLNESIKNIYKLDDKKSIIDPNWWYMKPTITC